MAHHYHIVSRLDMTQFGGTANDHYYGPGLPMDDARRDAQAMADERGLTQFAGGIWGDAEWYENQSTFVSPDAGQSISIDPCDNEINYDMPWNRWRDEVGIFHRAPKGMPCSSLIKKEYADFFFQAEATPSTNPRMEEKEKIFTAMYKMFNLMQNSQSHQVANEPEDAFNVLNQAITIMSECVHSTYENSALFTTILNDPYVWDKPHS